MKNILKVICFIILIAFPVSGRSDDNEYDIKKIPLRLLNNTNAVIRKYNIRFEAEDIRNAVESVIIAVTIFNKSAQDQGMLRLPYDKFRELDEIDAIIYNADGEEVRDLGKDDMKDYSDFENYTLYSDNRVKYIELFYDRFPYTVEFTYTYRYNGYLYWPEWYSRFSTYSVQETSFEVITPENYDLRYWSNKEKGKPEISVNGRKKIYKWQQENLLALSPDTAEEDIEDFAMIVSIAPNDFELDGYKGKMNSWQEFGSWYNILAKDKDILPQEALNEINNLFSPDINTYRKIEACYKYLQSKTRYVSVQLGIGGWQPYDVSYVYKNGYGDCKALSNYMVSILKHLQIPAYPVLIKTGHHRIPLKSEFPSNQFNHVIVCVPLEKDTVWLECTSQITPCGTIGWQNENRDALMVTPEGGIIVKTPVSTSGKNSQIKSVTVQLASNAAGYTNSEIIWTGNQYDYVNYIANKSTPLEQENWIKNLLDVPDVKVKAYSFNQENKSENKIILSTELSLHYGSISGKRMFFYPNLMERRKNVPKDLPERISPVRLKYPYLDIDSVLYTIPGRYKVETVPKEVSIDASFGTFFSGIVDQGDNTILYVRKLEMKDYVIPAEKYYEYQKFFTEVVRADKQQVVLVKE